MNKPKLWTGDFALLLGISFLAFVVCQALNNGTPIYVTSLGGTTAFAGWLILEFSILAAISRITVGRIIDRGSRKRVMLAGSIILLTGTVGALAMPGIEPQLVHRALQGIGFGCVTTASSTAAADVLPQERLGEGIGYFGLGQSLGFAIGPTLAVVLTSMVFNESLFVGVSCIAAALILFVACCSYESHPDRLPETSAYRQRAEQLREQRKEARQAPSAASAADTGGAKGIANSKPASKPNESGMRGLISSLFEKRALPGVIPMATCCLGYSIIVTYVSLYGTLNDIPNPGTFFILAAITMTAVRLGGGSLIDRIQPHILFALPMACGIISLVMLANAVNVWVFYIAGAFFGISMGLAFPLLNSVCVKNTAPERWGAASALYGLANDAGIGIGALIWGAVIDVIGYEPVMYCGAVTLALAYVLAFLVFPRTLER